MQHLKDQQQEVEEPPGRERPDYGPALKHCGVQDPGKPRDKTDVQCEVTCLLYSLLHTHAHKR